jgi:hypothetical protein
MMMFAVIEDAFIAVGVSVGILTIVSGWVALVGAVFSK